MQAFVGSSFVAMNTVIKPIKRSKFLAPLSREHHDDLLFSWKIHRGLAMGIKLDRIIRYCNWFYESHLKIHFMKEETALSRIISMEHPMMFRMLEDHEAIRMKLNMLNEVPTPGRLEHLARFISRHVRFEEREMFHLIEAIANQDQLKKLYSDLISSSTSKEEWNDEFWIST